MAPRSCGEGLHSAGVTFTPCGPNRACHLPTQTSSCTSGGLLRVSVMGHTPPRPFCEESWRKVGRKYMECCRLMCASPFRSWPNMASYAGAEVFGPRPGRYRHEPESFPHDPGWVRDAW